MSSRREPPERTALSRLPVLVVALWMLTTGAAEAILDDGEGLAIALGALSGVELSEAAARALAVARGAVAVGAGSWLASRPCLPRGVAWAAALQLALIAAATSLSALAPLLAVGVGVGVGVGLLQPHVLFAAAIAITVPLGLIGLADRERTALSATPLVLVAVAATVGCSPAPAEEAPARNGRPHGSTVFAELAGDGVVALAVVDGETSGTGRIADLDANVGGAVELPLRGAPVRTSSGEVRGLAFGPPSEFVIRAPTAEEWPWDDIRWDAPSDGTEPGTASVRPGSSVEILGVWGEFRLGTRAMVASVHEDEFVAWLDPAAWTSPPPAATGLAAAPAPVLGTTRMMGRPYALVGAGPVIGSVVSRGDGTVRVRLVPPSQTVDVSVRVLHGQDDVELRTASLTLTSDGSRDLLTVTLLQLLTQSDADCATSARVRWLAEDLEEHVGTVERPRRSTLSRRIADVAAAALGSVPWSAGDEFQLEVILR